MKTIAIICEYNPFHNGHAIQLSKIRAEYGNDCRILALMSGSTVQRGQLAIYPKYARAEAAVQCGVDLVLELPCPYSCGSAEFFAQGAVKLLNALGTVDILCFGSESGELSHLLSVARNLRNPEYIAALKTLPSAESHQRSAEALYREQFGEGYPSSPNDILAAEYLAALSDTKSEIQPFTYRREPGFSASDSRAALRNGEEAEDLLPAAAYEVLSKHSVTPDSLYSAVALHTLRNTPSAFLDRFYGMNGGVSGCLKNRANEASDLTSLLALCTTRKYSTARLRRAVLSSVLEITVRDMAEPPLFTNLLAASRHGREILSEMRKKSKIPVITKKADSRILSPDAERQYEIGVRADNLFALARGEVPAAMQKIPPYIAD